MFEPEVEAIFNLPWEITFSLLRQDLFPKPALIPDHGKMTAAEIKLIYHATKPFCFPF